MKRRMTPSQLSQHLRGDDSAVMLRRRAAVAFNLVACGAMGVVTLYQMGLVRRLPEPRWRFMDSAKVNGSSEAYAYLSTPDALLGLLSYATTVVLAGMGGPDRARRRPALPLLLAAKSALDSSAAAKLTVDQWTRHRAFCIWCLLAAAATWLAGLQVWPEARQAWHQLHRGRS